MSACGALPSRVRGCEAFLGQFARSCASRLRVLDGKVGVCFSLTPVKKQLTCDSSAGINSIKARKARSRALVHRVLQVTTIIALRRALQSRGKISVAEKYAISDFLQILTTTKELSPAEGPGGTNEE